MNAVWNSYGQLCGCPEIFKKSCKFFCRELDIRVTKCVKMNALQATFAGIFLHPVLQRTRLHIIFCAGQNISG